ADIFRESFEREDDPVPQDVESEVLDVLPGHVPAAAEIGERATGEHEVDGRARARTVADVLRHITDAVLGGLPRRGREPDDVLHERRIDEDLVDFTLQLDETLGRHYRDDRRHPSGHPFDDDEFIHLVRVPDEDLQHESVDLSLGEVIGPLGIDRVLRGHDEERIRDFVGLAADGHLPLLHDFEKRALDLRGSAVDLVGEQEIREHRTEGSLKVSGALVVNARTNEVRGHEVGSELDPFEVAGDGLSNRLDRQGLRQTGYAFDEQMAARQQTHHEALEQVVLPDDHFLDLEKKPAC